VDEIYRSLGREREHDLLRDAERLHCGARARRLRVKEAGTMANRNIGRKIAGAFLIAARGLARRRAIAAVAALALIGGSAGAVTFAATRDASPASGTMPDRTRAPFWPHETGALAGTAETYVDMRADGSYYDPSLGRRVSPAPFWPHETGTLAGTAETYVDMRADGSYYDPSLRRRISGR
jgi:hypothetical protein